MSRSPPSFHQSSREQPKRPHTAYDFMRGNVETYQNTFWMDIGVDCVHQPMYSVLVAILQYLPSGNGSPLFSTSDDFQGEASTFTNPILSL